MHKKCLGVKKKNVVAFSLLEGFGGKLRDAFPSCTFFFLKWRSAHATNSTLQSLCQDQSTVTQQVEMTGQEFPDELHVSFVPDMVPHYAWTA